MPVSVFFSYSHADEALRDQLEKQLAILRRQGVVETWHDRRIGAGEEWASVIDAHVERDDIILLLVSSDFLASDYCYDREMARAVERHDAGAATVIPVILRPCDWQGTPFGKLQATPTDGKPITSFPDRDQAMLEVARAVRAAAERLGAKAAIPPETTTAQEAARTSKQEEPVLRSSNLRVAKQFTERDKDAFRHDGFDYISRFFEGSAAELEARNPGVECSFRRIDANRFTASAYRNGKAVSRCTIFMGGDRHFGTGIAYVHGETTDSNTYNESLSVEADDQALFFRPMGMARFAGERDHKLSYEGAAEFYWELFIARLQER